MLYIVYKAVLIVLAHLLAVQNETYAMKKEYLYKFYTTLMKLKSRSVVFDITTTKIYYLIFYHKIHVLIS